MKKLFHFPSAFSVSGVGGSDYVASDEVNNPLFVSHGIELNVIDLSSVQPKNEETIFQRATVPAGHKKRYVGEFAVLFKSMHNTQCLF